MFSTRSPRLSCSGLMHRLGAPVFRCQGKRRVYSLHARKDAVEAFLAAISSWLEVSAPPQGRVGAWHAVPAGPACSWATTALAGSPSRDGHGGGAFGHCSPNSCQ